MDIKNVVKSVLANIEEREKKESDIFKAWGKAAGKSASEHSKPTFLKAKRLVVNVTDSAWLYKLTLEKGKLLKRFNDNLKIRKKAKKIQFRIGKVD